MRLSTAVGLPMVLRNWLEVMAAKSAASMEPEEARIQFLAKRLRTASPIHASSR